MIILHVRSGANDSKRIRHNTDVFAFNTHRVKIFLVKMSAAKEESFKSVIDPVTGEFKRPAAQFRNFISSKPNAEFPPEKGRYHLYVSYACPWGMCHSGSAESK